jgi:hypothetical protein
MLLPLYNNYYYNNIPQLKNQPFITQNVLNKNLFKKNQIGVLLIALIVLDEVLTPVILKLPLKKQAKQAFLENASIDNQYVLLLNSSLAGIVALFK